MANDPDPLLASGFQVGRATGPLGNQYVALRIKASADPNDAPLVIMMDPFGATRLAEDLTKTALGIAEAQRNASNN
jgi:hypothetical protein